VTLDLRLKTKMDDSTKERLDEPTFDADMEELKQQWTLEQLELSKRVSEVDNLLDGGTNINLFGGLDISFIEGDSVNACACYVVIDKDFKVVYQDVSMVKLTAPYIPSFLGFREADILSEMVSRQKSKEPSVTPEVLMVDGNGLLHPRCCGTACHVGLATGLPTIGVAKNLHLIEDLGLEGGRGEAARRLKESFKGVQEVGHQLPLLTQKGRLLGAAVKTSRESKNPVFVSVGSNLSLKTAVNLVTSMSRHRIPEPIRQADFLSREYLRLHHPSPRQVQAVRLQGQTRKQQEQGRHFKN